MTRHQGSNDKDKSHEGKVANDTNKTGEKNATQLNQGHRTPERRRDRESHVGGSNQSQTRRGPVGGDHSR